MGSRDVREGQEGFRIKAEVGRRKRWDSLGRKELPRAFDTARTFLDTTRIVR
ncbi:hypothetical protein M413DRAFT_448369 [Hebeloma cylindrosporum]|uniref:Uncharacterized protein n=1 Tax=Hebeloma cylindrosporum TaxID=76867 RepID=A0A0C3BZU0_HEBCY|nr:hypothetical protein M413DRAFT_448369 [Hebeloma cylindrosporum h7]